MFNVKVVFNVDPTAYFGKITDFLTRADDELYLAAQEAYAVTTQPTLDALRIYPPKPARPMEWLSVAQQRAARARMKRLGNYPYKRTGGYARGWTISYLRALGGTVLTLANTTRDGTGIAYPLYVGGAIDPRAPGLHQQPFHRITGWQASAPLVTAWANEVIARTSANFIVRMKRIGRVTGTTVTYP